MMSAKAFHTLQARANMQTGTTENEIIPMSEYLKVCRKYIETRLPKEYYTPQFGGIQEREDYMRNLIDEFIEATPKRVEGYINQDNTINIDALSNDLSV